MVRAIDYRIITTGLVRVSFLTLWQLIAATSRFYESLRKTILKMNAWNFIDYWDFIDYWNLCLDLLY